MRMLLKYLIVGVLIASCSLNDGTSINFEPLQIISAELPDSFELNKTYEITVNYQVPDNCTSFGGFDVRKRDTTARDVVVFGSAPSDQNDCEQVATESKASFNFIFLYDKPYVFRFWQGTDEDGQSEYLEITVPSE